jgi:queuine tRNA-ribosyltransferase
MQYFQYGKKKIRLPVFFPDATKGFIKSLDTEDIGITKTPGILVNTFHLYRATVDKVLRECGGIKNFMNWKGAVISDSGGFQAMSLIKSKVLVGEIIDKGILYKAGKRKTKVFTPEDSVRFQMLLNTDMVVVLDDFTPPKAPRAVAQDTVTRTVMWARRCKDEFENICKRSRIGKDKRPYILGVVQGGDYLDLRKECADKLLEIGFDGFGYGGWPINDKGKFNYKVASCIATNTPSNYFLFGLGIGKPKEIVSLVKMGYDIFDCVLPTRDARHGRLYMYNADSIDKINPIKNNFYSFYTPNKKKYRSDNGVISKACDCILCKKYSRAYLAHLFKERETTAMRLSTIHNLRFYSILMERLRKIYWNLPK